MEMEIVLPEEIPVMTLPGATFFPQALMPLHIFEPRYREMLSHVLDDHRMFAVAALADTADPTLDEPPCRVATVGMIRACQKSDDGTSNLLLHGLVRVRISEIVREHPYRTIRIRPLASEPGATAEENQTLRLELTELLVAKQELAGRPSNQLDQFLQTIDDPETFVDVAAFNLCEDAALKQKLLETLNLNTRLKLFGRKLRAEVATLRLARRLQGGLTDEDIANN